MLIKIAFVYKLFFILFLISFDNLDAKEALHSSVFNIVMSSQLSTINHNKIDPLLDKNSAVNSFPTQVTNRPFNISIIALANDAMHLASFKGVLLLELIEGVDYLDTTKCESAQLLSPSKSEPSMAYIFTGDKESHFSNGSFQFSKANKNVSFRVRYLKKINSNEPEEWSCSSNSLNCFWEMLRTKFEDTKDAIPCENVCKPSDTNRQTLEACTQCLFSSQNTSTVCARDNFAVRPEKFVFINTKEEDIQLLKAGRTFDFELKAQDFNTSYPSLQYSFTDAHLILNQGNLDANKTLYTPDNTIATQKLKGILSFKEKFDFINGTAQAKISFSDVGKVNIKVIDTQWAKVDIEKGDSANDCSEKGSYVCGDINATFIPDHFAITNAHLFNSNATTYTYLSNDLNISAAISLTLRALNSTNATTLNFTTDAWENPVNITFTLPSTGITNLLEKKKEINRNENLGFISGVYTIDSTNTANINKLIFNYHRDTNTAQNPFLIQGSDIELNVTSQYKSSLVLKTTAFPDNNATFIYGRTHAKRYIFMGNSGNVFIHYESYCSDVVNTNRCDKRLLPNGTKSKRSDDPRWFINSKYTKNLNTIGTINQKKYTFVKVTNTPTHLENFTLTYQGSTYPYKTTMQNRPATWLIYNKYKKNPMSNEFEVEFMNTDSSQAGENETNTTTNTLLTHRVNRRSMW